MADRIVDGFEFDLMLDRELILGVRLQGDGGLMGDGWLCALNSGCTRLTPDGVAASRLREAQAAHRRSGHVRIAYPDRHYSERIEQSAGYPVACRPIYGKGA